MGLFIFIVIIAIGILVVLMYNSLIAKKNGVENTYGSIEVMLKKRYDLIPNLVDVVKEYMGYENEILKEITELRTQVLKNDLSQNEKVELNNEISNKLGGIKVAVEAYPELKANENFLNLQRNLNEVESQIAAARRTYNTAVTDYNNAIEMFPSNILAGFLKYQRKELFQVNSMEREEIRINNLFE